MYYISAVNDYSKREIGRLNEKCNTMICRLLENGNGELEKDITKVKHVRGFPPSHDGQCKSRKVIYLILSRWTSENYKSTQSYSENICLQTLFLLVKCRKCQTKELFVSPANSSLDS